MRANLHLLNLFCFPNSHENKIRQHRLSEINSLMHSTSFRETLKMLVEDPAALHDDANARQTHLKCTSNRRAIWRRENGVYSVIRRDPKGI